MSEFDSDISETDESMKLEKEAPAAGISWGTNIVRRGRLRGLRYFAVVLVVVLMVMGTTAVSAFAYDQNREDQIVPDLRVRGILVGGLTREQAGTVLRRQLEEIRARTFNIRAYDKVYAVSLAQLDVDAEIDSALDHAFEAGRQLGIGGRLKRWLGGGGEPIDIPLEVRPNGEVVEKKVVASIAGQVNREATDAAIDESSDELIFRPPRPGVELEAKASSDILINSAIALIEGSVITEVVLPAKELQPEGNDIGAAILVRVSEQKLYYYENATLVATYKVSTGTSGYPTPLGRFRIVEKIMNPSWTNPAPDGWGKDMPARIGPGPNNPLGTRALQLNSPGILIHGTTKVNLLGSPASHGCIRMAGPDIEGLFPKVPINTPVFIRK